MVRVWTPPQPTRSPPCWADGGELPSAMSLMRWAASCGAPASQPLTHSRKARSRLSGLSSLFANAAELAVECATATAPWPPGTLPPR